ncbi:flagellar assembly protein FliW [Thermoleophilum album]|uniref:Flagellar assembly factor FliW n=1 Tax=Thermoleophilum album TaxID=29539 RepID=A0A1H6FXK9_THEAL|nr:flagellar assembly protein FliW [Thermoleophilum album]SEH14753.1 flagellar assembly factor FliW [Thermoleophilum album]
MTIISETTRFGRIEVPEEAVVDFPHGLVGFESRRFTLIARAEKAVFLWLQSLDEPALAVPVTNPWLFFPDFELIVGDDELERLGIDTDQLDVYVVVQASERLEDFRANLLAPIVIGGRRGWQVINESPTARLRAPLFGERAHQAA